MDRRSFIRLASCTMITPLATRYSFAQTIDDALYGLTPDQLARLAMVERRCATLAPDAQSLRELSTRAGRMKEADVSNFETRIPVVFHVIHDGEKYRVSEQRIKQQVDVLNADFFAADISFYPKRIAYHDNKSWCRLVPSTFAVRLGVPDVEAQMKAQLGETPAEALNVYIVSPRIDDLLGWARFPWDLAITPQQDGVVLAHHTLPGNPADRSQLGRTATHEVGHWLGLLHTFQNGCSEPGDGIHDTPFRAGPSYQCPPRPSLCAPTGDNHERIANFMDYLGDACATAFTAGQIERMKAMIRLFRPKLLANLQNSPRAQSRGSGGRPSTNVDRLNAIMAD